MSFSEDRIEKSDENKIMTIKSTKTDFVCFEALF